MISKSNTKEWYEKAVYVVVVLVALFFADEINPVMGAVLFILFSAAYDIVEIKFRLRRQIKEEPEDGTET